MTVTFQVQGRPQPQGSTRAFMPKGFKHPIITTDNTKLKPWRQDVASQAMLAMANREPFCGAVAVIAKFYFLKPKSAKASIVHKITKPDIDKLERGIFDSLTGICFVDDSQVVSSSATKEFCASNERVEVEVREI